MVDAISNDDLMRLAPALKGMPLVTAGSGVAIGLPRPLAKQLAEQNLLGSMRYAMASPKHPAELRNDVTSPAGTTAAGLNAMEKAGLRSAISDGVRAAFAARDEVLNDELVTAAAECALVVKVGKACVYDPRA